MPIYEYRCRKCGKDVDVFHSMGDLDVPRPCRICGEIMKRIVSSFSFCFPENNRNRVLKALNGEYPLPAQPHDRPRIEKALARGLDRVRPVIGRGI